MADFALGIAVGALAMSIFLSFVVGKLRFDHQELTKTVMHLAEKQIVLKHAFDDYKRKAERATK